MEDRVSNPAEVWKNAVVILLEHPRYRRGESLFVNLNLSLVATQRVFGSRLVVQHWLVGNDIESLSI